VSGDVIEIRRSPPQFANLCRCQLVVDWIGLGRITVAPTGSVGNDRHTYRARSLAIAAARSGNRAVGSALWRLALSCAERLTKR